MHDAKRIEDAIGRLAHEHRPPLIHFRQREAERFGDGGRFVPAGDEQAQAFKPAHAHKPLGGRLGVKSFSHLAIPFYCIYNLCNYKYCNAADAVKMPKRKPEPEMAPCLYLRLRAATKRLLALYEAHMAEAGLSMAQFGLLIAAAEEPELTMSRLAAKRDISPSTLTRTLRPLEAEGLIETFADAQSKRVRRVRLTQAGRARTRTAYAAWKKAQAEASSVVAPKLVDQVLGATEKLAR